MGARRGAARAWLVPLLLALPCAAAAAPEPPDVEKLLDHLDDLYRSSSSVARVEVLAVTPHATRTLRLKAWSRGRDHALIVIEDPPREAGTATLRVGANLWNYLPRIARTIRVPPSMMLGSWMGTDLTNDDLVKESSLRKDYVARIEGRVDDPPGWRLTLEVRPDVVGRWSKIEIRITDDDLPVEERHYDRRGRLARVLTFDEVKTLGGRRLPTRMALVPADEQGRRTEVRYLDIAFGVPIPDETFSLSRLEENR